MLAEKLRSRAKRLGQLRRSQEDQDLLLEAADFIDLVTKERHARTTAIVKELYPKLDTGITEMLAFSATIIEQIGRENERALEEILALTADMRVDPHDPLWQIEEIAQRALGRGE